MFSRVAILLAVLSINLFGDRLRDALDPRTVWRLPEGARPSGEQLRHVVAVEQLALLGRKADPDRRVPAQHLEGAEL